MITKSRTQLTHGDKKIIKTALAQTARASSNRSVRPADNGPNRSATTTPAA